jgi:hypothetical protein
LKGFHRPLLHLHQSAPLVRWKVSIVVPSVLLKCCSNFEASGSRGFLTGVSFSWSSYVNV